MLNQKEYKSKILRYDLTSLLYDNGNWATYNGTSHVLQVAEMKFRRKLKNVTEWSEFLMKK